MFNETLSFKILKMYCKPFCQNEYFMFRNP